MIYNEKGIENINIHAEVKMTEEKKIKIGKIFHYKS